MKRILLDFEVVDSDVFPNRYYVRSYPGYVFEDIPGLALCHDPVHHRDASGKSTWDRDPSMWEIMHIESGMYILRHIPSLEQAVSILKEFGNQGIPWESPLEVVKTWREKPWFEAFKERLRQLEQQLQ